MLVFGGYDYGYTYYSDLWFLNVNEITWVDIDIDPKPAGYCLDHVSVCVRVSVIVVNISNHH